MTTVHRQSVFESVTMSRSDKKSVVQVISVEESSEEDLDEIPSGAEGAFLGFFGIDVKSIPQTRKAWKNDPRKAKDGEGTSEKSPEKKEEKKAEDTLDLGEATQRAISKMFNIRALMGEAEGGRRKKPKKGLLNQVHRGRGIPDDMKTVEQSLLYEQLRPLFVCMKAAGMFFVRYRRTSGNSIKEMCSNVSPLQCYCVVMCIVLLGNFIRSLIAFENVQALDTVLFFKIVTSIFFYESMSRAYIAFWMCYNRENSIQKLFLNIEKICYSDRIIPYENSLGKAVVALLIMSVSATVVNVATLAYGFFGSESIQDIFINYLVPKPQTGSSWELGFKIFLLLMNFINSMVAMFSLSFYTITCYVMYKEFEYLCRTLATKIRDDGEMADDLEKFRIQHQKRCQLVNQADSMFKYYIANALTTNVPLLCLLLYTSVYNDTGMAYRIISLWRMMYVFLQMIVVTGAATYINTQVSLSMFLNRLSSTQVGLSCLDMFVINKPTILTVVGLILTYFFLLLQFRMPTDEAASGGANATLISVEACQSLINFTLFNNYYGDNNA